MPTPDKHTQHIIVCNMVDRANELAADLGLTVGDGYRFVWARDVDQPMVFTHMPAHEVNERLGVEDG